MYIAYYSVSAKVLIHWRVSMVVADGPMPIMQHVICNHHDDIGRPVRLTSPQT